MNVLLTNTYPQGPLSILQSHVPKELRLITLEKATREELLSKIGVADYLLVSGRLQIDEELIQKAERLMMVQRTGVGTDTLAVEALKKRDIPVYVNRGINAVSVAEHAVMMMLASLKNLCTVTASVRKGVWKKQETGVRNRTLSGKSIGFIGMGNIGIEVAKRLIPFGTSNMYCDIDRLEGSIERELGLTYCNLEEILRKSDIITIHCALNSSTRHLIGKQEIELIKDGAIIINTSRGGIVDEEALIEGLKSRKILGCGLDVFENEPISKNHPFSEMENVILTPHIGGVTFESFSEMMRGAMYNIKMFHEGKQYEIEESRLI